jgi:hypothetical protein
LGKLGRNLAVTGYMKCHGKVIQGSISKIAKVRPRHTKSNEFFLVIEKLEDHHVFEK